MCSEEPVLECHFQLLDLSRVVTLAQTSGMNSGKWGVVWASLECDTPMYVRTCSWSVVTHMSGRQRRYVRTPYPDSLMRLV